MTYRNAALLFLENFEKKDFSNMKPMVILSYIIAQFLISQTYLVWRDLFINKKPSSVSKKTLKRYREYSGNSVRHRDHLSSSCAKVAQ
jgi:hypothetical protein